MQSSTAVGTEQATEVKKLVWPMILRPTASDKVFELASLFSFVSKLASIVPVFINRMIELSIRLLNADLLLGVFSFFFQPYVSKEGFFFGSTDCGINELAYVLTDFGSHGFLLV